MNVELGWKPHFHRGTGGAAGADFRLDERGQLGPWATELRQYEGRRNDEQRDRRGDPMHDYSTGLSGMKEGLAAPPSICTLWPFTGGRS